MRPLGLAWSVGYRMLLNVDVAGEGGGAVGCQGALLDPGGCDWVGPRRVGEGGCFPHPHRLLKPTLVTSDLVRSACENGTARWVTRYLGEGAVTPTHPQLTMDPDLSPDPCYPRPLLGLRFPAQSSSVSCTWTADFETRS